MNTSRRLAALLLCLSLLAGLLSGCGNDPQKQETESTAPHSTASEPVTVPVTTTEPVPTTTEAPADYAADYLAARAVLEAESAITIVTELSQTVTVMAETITETQTEKVQYQNLGGEDLIVASDRTLKLDVGSYELKQVYSAGNLYSQMGESRFHAPEDGEYYLTTQTPLALLNPANYESVALEGEQIRFTGALAGEEWALPEGAELISAEGSATLKDGALTAQRYEISFRYGGGEIARSYASTLRPGTEEDLAARIPAEDEDAVELESTEALLLLLRAENTMDHLHTISFDINGTDVSQAADCVMMQQEEAHFYGQDQDMILSDDFSSKVYDLSGNEQEDVQLKQSLIGKTYRYQVDDEEPEEQSFGLAASVQLATSYLMTMRDEVADIIPAPKELVSAAVYDMGDYLLVEYSCGESFGRTVDKVANHDMFSEETLLMDMADSYLLDTLEGYVAVEKHSWLPTAVGVSYKAAHTIEGYPYIIGMEKRIGLSIGDPDTYEEITDELLPETEPEEKANPVFYEVTGENGEKLYLFGTIHVGDVRTGFLPQAIYDAFDAADALAVEFDDDAFEEEIKNDPELLEKVAGAYYYTDQSSIKDHLEEDVYETAVRYLKITGQYNDQAEMMRPFVWGNAIENFYLSQGRRLSSSKGVDHRLMARAREQEKEIRDVESGEAQLSMMAGYSDKLQQLLLEEALGTTRREYLDGVNELYELWCSGDEAALIEELAAADEEELSELSEEERELYEEYHSAMETSRNTDMLAVAEGYLESGETVFFAVGLAHLLGDGGLVQALRDAGYTVTLIQN